MEEFTTYEIEQCNKTVKDCEFCEEDCKQNINNIIEQVKVDIKEWKLININE